MHAVLGHRSLDLALQRYGMRAERLSRPPGANFLSTYFTVTWPYEGCDIVFTLEVPNKDWSQFRLLMNDADLHLRIAVLTAVKSALEDLCQGNLQVPQLNQGHPIFISCLEYGWITIQYPNGQLYTVTTHEFLNLEFAKPGSTPSIRMYEVPKGKESRTFVSVQNDQVGFGYPNCPDPDIWFDRQVFALVLNILDRIV